MRINEDHHGPLSSELITALSCEQKPVPGVCVVYVACASGLKWVLVWRCGGRPPPLSPDLGIHLHPKNKKTCQHNVNRSTTRNSPSHLKVQGLWGDPVTAERRWLQPRVWRAGRHAARKDTVELLRGEHGEHTCHDNSYTCHGTHVTITVTHVMVHMSR